MGAYLENFAGKVKVQTIKWLTEPDGHTLRAGIIFHGVLSLNPMVILLPMIITSDFPSLAG